MEGPAFSTVAESELHRSFGADVIGMTVCAEAKLAREAEISYAVLAMATDYDCWRPEEEAVNVNAVIATLKANVVKAQQICKLVVPMIKAHTGDHPQKGAMQGAIMTAPDAMPRDRMIALAPLLRAYYDIPTGAPAPTAAVARLDQPPSLVAWAALGLAAAALAVSLRR